MQHKFPTLMWCRDPHLHVVKWTSESSQITNTILHPGLNFLYKIKDDDIWRLSRDVNFDFSCWVYIQNVHFTILITFINVDRLFNNITRILY